MGQNTRVIKFYLDDKKISKVERDRIIQFLSECQIVENKLIDYYWDNFNDVLIAKDGKYFYNNRIDMPKPRLKFNHYMNILFQVYEMMKAIQVKIIKYKLHFKIKNDILKQRIYNYCSGFCFQWDRLEKYVAKQLKQYKKKDTKYYDFLLKVQEYIDNKELYFQLKEDIEDKFWEEKSKFNKPVNHNYQIRCSTFHTIKIIKQNENLWVFKIDNNELIGGSEKRGVFDTISIPVKISNYHRNILSQYTLANTFNIKLNNYNKLEIIGCYEVEKVDIPLEEINNYIGIDIGLKKLISSSDGKVIKQNPKLIKKLKRIVNKQANRQSLEEHLKKKYNDENFKLPDKNYTKMQNKLTRFVTCNNRYKIKQFVSNYKGTNTQIIMEDLDLHEVKTRNKKINNMLKRLHIHRIKEDVIKYSKENGIKTAEVNPAFTSQQCPICGYVDKRNRKTQEQFKCIKCGHESNADFNASINIRERYFNKRISTNTPYWRVKDILSK